MATAVSTKVKAAEGKLVVAKKNLAKEQAAHDKAVKTSLAVMEKAHAAATKKHGAVEAAAKKKLAKAQMAHDKALAALDKMKPAE